MTPVEVGILSALSIHHSINQINQSNFLMPLELQHRYVMRVMEQLAWERTWCREPMYVDGSLASQPLFLRGYFTDGTGKIECGWHRIVHT